MRLDAVTVQNYRSIVKRTHFNLGNHTTLVGPNNEGKSNLLRALGLGMDVINNWRFLGDAVGTESIVRGLNARSVLGGNFRRNSRMDSDWGGYEWYKDFPILKQSLKSPQKTIIRLDFTLSSDERRQLKRQLQIKNNEHLGVQISIDKDSVSLGIAKPGRSSAIYQLNARSIADFISQRISYVSIPAIRTSRQAQRLISDVTQLQLNTLQSKDEYIQLSNELNQLREKAVKEIESGLSASIKRYFPKIRAVEIATADIRRGEVAEDLLIDDGVNTSIDDKGDGVKSLVAMALIEEVARLRSADSSIILAVDEPEAHLHSESIHDLKLLLEEFSTDQQVIIATHNAILVNSRNPESNLIVKANGAKPAASIAQIREVMGIRLHENLDSAEVVILVEGESDLSSLRKLLSTADKNVEGLFATNRIVVKAVNGSAKMVGLLKHERSTLTKVICVLDSDEAARLAMSELLKSRQISEQEIYMFEVEGKSDSEFEDLFEPRLYLELFNEAFKTDFSSENFDELSTKWSDSVKKLVGTHHGKSITNAEIGNAKKLVHSCIGSRANPYEDLKPSVRPQIDSLVHLLLQG